MKQTGKEEETKIQRNHPRGGSLSISNPAGALDTLSSYHGEKKKLRTQAQ